MKYLVPLYLKVPSTEWLSVVKKFEISGNTERRLGLSTENMWLFENHDMVVRTIIIKRIHTGSF